MQQPLNNETTATRTSSIEHEVLTTKQLVDRNQLLLTKLTNLQKKYNKYRNRHKKNAIGDKRVVRLLETQQNLTRQLNRYRCALPTGVTFVWFVTYFGFGVIVSTTQQFVRLISSVVGVLFEQMGELFAILVSALYTVATVEL